jgi:hypothetical protein
MADAERFLERFAAFGRNPSPELYEQLFDPRINPDTDPARLSCLD